MCKVALLAIDDSALQSLSARRPSLSNPATRLLPRFKPFVFYSRNCDGLYRWLTEKPLRACLRCTPESITDEMKAESGESGGSSTATPDLRVMVLRTAPQGVEPNGP